MQEWPRAGPGCEGIANVERVFLGWHRPALASTLSWLIDRYGGGPSCDMSRVIVVVPGARVGRRLAELLARAARGRKQPFFPPCITTVGQFPELLYEARLPFASTLIQHLVWARALRETP